MLFVFEDIHWADASQLDLLESLASRVRDVPTMLLALTRPELRDTRPGWGAGLNHHTAMELHPLNPDEAKSLAARLFPALAEMPGAVEHVAVSAEGNPLFIEELAASLAERVDKAAAELPTNVKTTIAARLDTLPSSARATLLDAAIIGNLNDVVKPPAHALEDRRPSIGCRAAVTRARRHGGGRGILRPGCGCARGLVF